MSCIGELFESGKRGLFSEKFIAYSEVKELGYNGFKTVIQNLYELDAGFIKGHSSELYDLLEKAEALTRRVQRGDLDLATVEASNHKSQITNHKGEPTNDYTEFGSGQLDDQWGRDQYA